jgi:hypothetical protein
MPVSDLNSMFDQLSGALPEGLVFTVISTGPNGAIIANIRTPDWQAAIKIPDLAEFKPVVLEAAWDHQVEHEVQQAIRDNRKQYKRELTAARDTNRSRRQSIGESREQRRQTARQAARKKLDAIKKDS